MASSYSNLHPVDEILSSLLIENYGSNQDLIAGEIFETVNVTDRTGTILLEEGRNFLGAGAGIDVQRAPGSSRAKISTFDRSSTTFACKIFAAEHAIAVEDLLDSQYPGSEEERAARMVGNVLALKREKRAADLLFSTAEFTNNATAANEFGAQVDAAGADPLTGLHKLKDKVRANASGVHPDSLIMGYEVFRALARNEEIRGYAGTASAGFASGSRILQDDVVISVLRDILGIPNIHVGSARQDTAVAGATSSESYIWGESIFMGCLRGSDAVTQRSGNVKAMPVAALSLQFSAPVSGAYDSLDRTVKYVYGEEVNALKKIDANLGYIVTDCLT
tara:strand:+ start:3849 stop:4853 length:1005 start_codon:yes stop_codon:yes gene_type:complete